MFIQISPHSASISLESPTRTLCQEIRYLPLRMSSVTHPRVPVGVISKLIELLPAATQEMAREIVHTAEFRLLETLEDQIVYIRDNTPFPLDVISDMLNVHRSTLHRYLQRAIAQRASNPAPPRPAERYGPNSALTIAEEFQVIQWILARQTKQDCASPREVREYAAKLRCASRQLQWIEGEHLSRDWWHKFKKRHQDLIGVKIAFSREAVRTRIDATAVDAYFAEIRAILTNLESPTQIVNMDETGFHSRIDRNRRRKCVFHNKCQVHVTFSEETSSTTLSLMAAVTGDGGVLAPMFVCKENVAFSSYELRTVITKLFVTKTQKGYATEFSMLEWIRNVIRHYVQRVARTLRREESMIYLIMDNCGVHNTPAVKAEFRKVSRLRVVWLPPHTSHFLQMLDASVFGQLKGAYRNLRTLPTRPKIEGKILRAFHAMWNAAFPRNVLAGFELTGFKYSMLADESLAIHLDEQRVLELTRSNCQIHDPCQREREIEAE